VKTQHAVRTGTPANPAKLAKNIIQQVRGSLAAGTHRRWLVTAADGVVMSITRSPPATLAEMKRDHAGAEIRPEPELAPVRPLDPEALAIVSAWLDAIGESDPTTRAEYIEGCARDPERLVQTFRAAVDLGIAKWEPAP
jgi:hypothetical protein